MFVKDLLADIQNRIDKGEIDLDSEVVIAGSDDYWGTLYHRFEKEQLKVEYNLQINGPKKNSVLGKYLIFEL